MLGCNNNLKKSGVKVRIFSRESTTVKHILAICSEKTKKLLILHYKPNHFVENENQIDTLGHLPGHDGGMPRTES